jgi:hypothetical protein
VNEIAQKTTVLDMKPVCVEVSSDIVRISRPSPSWDVLVTFLIEDIVSLDIISKNAVFLGIVVCRCDGIDGVCYVIQSDDSLAIKL